MNLPGRNYAPRRRAWPRAHGAKISQLRVVPRVCRRVGGLDAPRHALCL